VLGCRPPGALKLAPELGGAALQLRDLRLRLLQVDPGLNRDGLALEFRQAGLQLRGLLRRLLEIRGGANLRVLLAEPLQLPLQAVHLRAGAR
jgi:hypothetical protein